MEVDSIDPKAVAQEEYRIIREYLDNEEEQFEDPEDLEEDWDQTAGQQQQQQQHQTEEQQQRPSDPKYGGTDEGDNDWA